MSDPRADIPDSPFADSPGAKPTEGTAAKVAPHEAGVPRRFGVGILLVITAMYAVLFAVLQSLQVPPMGFLFVAVFFTIVGLGQMLLFKGNRPRRASVLIGACTLPGLVFAFRIASDPSSAGSIQPFGCALLALIIDGALAGYLSGLLIAGVFLFINKIQRTREKRRRKDASAAP